MNSYFRLDKSTSSVVVLFYYQGDKSSIYYADLLIVELGNINKRFVKKENW